MANRGTRGGKRKQRAKARQQGVGSPAVLTGQGVRNRTGFDAAGVSERRGFIYWPTQDTKKELTPRSRKKILSDARWAYENVGLARRLVDGPVGLIGHLTPQADSGDSEWDKKAEEAFWIRAENPLAFDRSGKLDFIGWQNAITRGYFRDCDSVTALAEAKASGGGQIVFYEAQQIDSGRTHDLPSNLYDGVFTDRMGRVTGYRVVDMDDPEKYFTVKANQAIFHAKLSSVGRVRGVSSMAPSLSNIKDLVETLADYKHGIKIAAQWGVALERAGSSPGGGGMGNELAQFLNLGGDGAEPSEDELLELDTILKGGRMQSTPAGTTLKTLQDTRPHPNVLDLLRWLVRDAAWAVGLAPEILWEHMGMNGTATRYLMAETRAWAQSEQRILQRSCQRLWTYFISREIAAGRLDQPKQKRWWKCKWIPQADRTIDLGRDGNLEIAQLDNDLTTLAECYAKRGKDWETELQQRARERAYMRELGLSSEEVV